MIIVPFFNINISVPCTSVLHYKHLSATNIMVLRTSVFYNKYISTIMMVLRTLLVYSIQLNTKLFMKTFGLFTAAELQNICSK